jgi:hypothetical protein
MQRGHPRAEPQRKLHLDVKTIFHTDYNPLDSYISWVYGQLFELVPDQELSNYSSKEITVKKEELRDYEQTKLDEFIQTGKGTGLFYILMKDLANRDLIPVGPYVIKIYW